MQVVFFGSPLFAAHILEKMVGENVAVVAVVTKPDKPQGRHLQVMPAAVKEFASQRLPNLPILQPKVCSSPEFVETLRSFQADLFVVVAYGEILSQAVLDIPPLGCVNVHASLLPHLRGAAPIPRALMRGDPKTGISIIRLVRKMDAGDILHQKELFIGPNTIASELEQELCDLGAQALLKVINDFTHGSIQAIAQDHAKATFADKIVPADTLIDWSKDARVIHNQIRGLSYHPGAWCLVSYKGQQKRLKVLRTEIRPLPETKTGTLLLPSKNSLVIACGKDGLALLEVQLEGRPVLAINDFLRGLSAEQLYIL
jgi:methionyl-tRNA formyltransferase